jgi:hypothetical protein
MSHYSEIPIEMKDEKSLISALERQGFKREQIEIHKDAQYLYGYHGDRREQKANIIIRRKYVGSMSNDIGFVKTAKGYSAIVSDFERNHKGYNEQWFGTLKKYYGVELAKVEAKKKGYKFQEEKTKEGKIRLILTK